MPAYRSNNFEADTALLNPSLPLAHADDMRIKVYYSAGTPPAAAIPLHDTILPESTAKQAASLPAPTAVTDKQEVRPAPSFSVLAQKRKKNSPVRSLAKTDSLALHNNKEYIDFTHETANALESTTNSKTESETGSTASPSDNGMSRMQIRHKNISAMQHASFQAQLEHQPFVLKYFCAEFAYETCRYR